MVCPPPHLVDAFLTAVQSQRPAPSSPVSMRPPPTAALAHEYTVQGNFFKISPPTQDCFPSVTAAFMQNTSVHTNTRKLLYSPPHLVDASLNEVQGQCLHQQELNAINRQLCTL